MTDDMDKKFEERIANLNKEHEERGSFYNAPAYQKRTYTVDEIQDILGVCRTSVYNLVNSGAFRVVRIGAHIRIPCKSFDEWLDGVPGDDNGHKEG